MLTVKAERKARARANRVVVLVLADVVFIAISVVVDVAFVDVCFVVAVVGVEPRDSKAQKRARCAMRTENVTSRAMGRTLGLRSPRALPQA